MECRASGKEWFDRLFVECGPTEIAFRFGTPAKLRDPFAEAACCASECAEKYPISLSRAQCETNHSKGRPPWSLALILVWEAVARCLADAGTKVVINYITNPETAEAIAVDLKGRGIEAIALKADIANEAEVKAMYAAIFKQYGTIDILCANASIQIDA